MAHLLLCCVHVLWVAHVTNWNMVFQELALYTLVLLLIVRTNFSEFSDDWHNR